MKEENNLRTQEEQALDRLFADYQPTLSPSAPFMDTLQKRMTAVDYVKQMQRARIRQYRMAVPAAFVMGTVAGILVFALQPDITRTFVQPLMAQLSPTQTAIVEMLHLRQLLLPGLCSIVSMAIISICSLRQSSDF